MSNMSYCRFENTLKNLRDCYNNWVEGGLDKSEQEAQKSLLNLCKAIVQDYDWEKFIKEEIVSRLEEYRDSLPTEEEIREIICSLWKLPPTILIEISQAIHKRIRGE